MLDGVSLISCIIVPSNLMLSAVNILEKALIFETISGGNLEIDATRPNFTGLPLMTASIESCSAPLAYSAFWPPYGLFVMLVLVIRCFHSGRCLFFSHSVELCLIPLIFLINRYGSLSVFGGDDLVIQLFQHRFVHFQYGRVIFYQQNRFMLARLPW